jgi:hypothetical protein
MSFGAYISSIYTLIGIFSVVLICAFAAWKGGPAERLGALVVVLAWLGADIARGFSNQMVPTITLLVSDVVVSGCFLFLAIRYSSLWLGAAMVFQSVGCFLHAAQLSDPSAPRWHGFIIYLLINNILSYLVLISLVGGAVATMMRRGRLKREKAAAEARAARRAAPVRVGPLPPATAT